MIVKHPREYVVDKLQYALNPKTIAVVGASRYSTKVGYKVVDGLLTWGYKGKIYPVNPRADKVAGFTAYKTVKDIPDEIDLAFLAVPAHIVKSVLEDCVEKKVKIVQDADAIYREEIENAGLDKTIGQYFAALTNMRSVGVMGDERTYDYAVALRAVNTVDFMTAEAAEIPYEVLNKVMSRVINEVRGVNRIFYDLTSKPPGTIEFE